VQIPKVQKNSQVTIVFFALLGSSHAKIARKTLLKLTPGRSYSPNPHPIGSTPSADY